mmetsp:Transcript_42120/g.124989  ORF Transcript_42120/g.124989 Transcript_42120/m.124989 type:complete len:218 (-) Transcript_42120:558-1211(-)
MGPCWVPQTCCAMFTRTCSRSVDAQTEVTASPSGSGGSSRREATSSTLRPLSLSTTSTCWPLGGTHRSCTRFASSHRCSSVPSTLHRQTRLSKPPETKRLPSRSQHTLVTGPACRTKTRTAWWLGGAQRRTERSLDAVRSWRSSSLQATQEQGSEWPNRTCTTEYPGGRHSQRITVRSWEDDARYLPSWDAAANQTSSEWRSRQATQCAGKGVGSHE